MTQYYTLGASWELGLPFNEIRTHECIESDGEIIFPTINVGSVSNMKCNDGNWICYRRNFIGTEVLFDLGIYDTTSELKIKSINRSIYGFGISMSTSTNLPSHRIPIKLRQYTSKREKGPISDISIHRIKPSMKFEDLNSHGRDISPPFRPIDLSCDSESQQIDSKYNFSHIQFTNAACAGGVCKIRPTIKLSIDLYADIRNEGDLYPVWIKISSRIFSPINVIGRSPNQGKSLRVQKKSETSRSE